MKSSQRQTIIIGSIAISLFFIIWAVQTKAQTISVDNSHTQGNEFNYLKTPHNVSDFLPEMASHSAISELLLPDAPSAASLFYPSVLYDAGIPSNSVDIGDLNNDGLDDVAFISGVGIYIYYQNEVGGLDNPVIYPTDTTYSIAIGDLNQDHLKDIVINNQYTASIGVYLQKTDGTLADVITYPTPNAPGLVQVADMNNDGLNDVVALIGDYSIAVYHQNESGILDAPVLYNNNYKFAVGLALGDVNNDGFTDVIRLNYSYTGNHAFVSVYIQHNGALLNPVYYDLEDLNSDDVTTGDVNGDGRTDVIVTGSIITTGPQVIILAQNETGGLSSPTTYGAYNSAANVKVTDINQDVLNDIIVTHTGRGKVSVYYQENNGSFINYALYSVAPAISGLYNHGLAVGDITDDGLPDLVISSGNSGLSVLEHTGLIHHTYLPATLKNYIGPIFDDFSYPTSGWPIADTAYNKYAYLNGEYQIVNKTNAYTALATAGHKKADFDISVDVRKANSNRGAYGIAYGITDDFSEYTSFIIWPDYQEWWLLLFSFRAGFSILDSGSTTIINSGMGTNKLRIIRQGTSVTCLINDSIVTSTILLGGEHMMGLFAAPQDGNFDARFDNYYLWFPQ